MPRGSDDSLAREAILILADVICALVDGSAHLLGPTKVEELLEEVSLARGVARRIDRPRGTPKKEE